MSYRVEEHYGTPGLPHYAGNGTPFGVIGGHSTETEAGEEALWNVLAWMAATGAQRGASYHELWAWTPEKPDDFLVARTVPPNRAAGSVGIGHTLNLDTWARECLNRSRNASDPNQGIYATAIVGRSKTIRDEWARDRRFVRFVHRRLVEIREESKRWQSIQLDRIAEHFRFQPTTRSDWGRLPANLTLEQRQAPPAERAKWHSSLADALGGLIVRDELPEEVVMPNLEYVPQLWRAGPGGAPLREQASDSAPVIATVPPVGIVFSVGEDAESGWRYVVAGDPERLLFAKRAHLTPLPPTPRDAQLHAGIAAVVNARAAGKPVPTEADGAALEAQLAAEQRRNGDIKQAGVDALRRQATGAKDLAAGAEAAAQRLAEL